MDDLDRALGRAWEIALIDETGSHPDMDELLPLLEAAGYAAVDRTSPETEYWCFSAQGVERAEGLGLLDDGDRALRRTWEIAREDLSDENDAELGGLIPQLVAAEYVAV